MWKGDTKLGRSKRKFFNSYDEAKIFQVRVCGKLFDLRGNKDRKHDFVVKYKVTKRTIKHYNK